MVPISLVIITKNEEKNIAACIQSALDIVDEVIVVDDHLSDDNTKQIVEELGGRYYSEPFNGYGPKKRDAVAKASHDWILSLDADERLSDSLKSSILQVKSKPNHQAYICNRSNIYCGKAIRYCGWYPDQQLRLWNRKYGNWNSNQVHEKVEMDKGIKVSYLKGDLIHYTMESLEDHIQRINRYTTLQAQIHMDSSVIVLYLKMLNLPLIHFIKIYFLKFGFLDGTEGYMIARISAMGKFWIYAKALEMKKK